MNSILTRAGDPVSMRLLLLVLAATLTVSSGVAGEEGPARPVVVETIPERGARAVPPDTGRIIVRFSEPMRDRSWSWCGGGWTYPEVTGPPRFLDDRTAELPVALEPGRTYQIGINCPSAQNFRSVSGLAAEPVRLVFTTTWGEGHLPVADATNHASMEVLLDVILHRYSHAERSGTDWEAVFGGGADWLLSAGDHREFSLRAALLLSPANDPHLYLVDPELGRLGTHHTFPTLNRDDAMLAAEIEGHMAHGRAIRSGRIGEFGYLAVDSWSLTPAEEEVLHRLMAEFVTETRGLVVDVRGNGGGVEDQARRLAGWFHVEPTIYARHRFRDPEAPGGWTEMMPRSLAPGGRGRHYPHPVAVLQGPVCLSSNEAFLMMMDAAPRVTRFGTASGGSSGNPGRVTLPNGVDVVFARWQSFTRRGESIEGVGIPPDVTVEWRAGARDEVLGRAVADLRLQHALSEP